MGDLFNEMFGYRGTYFYWGLDLWIVEMYFWFCWVDSCKESLYEC